MTTYVLAIDPNDVVHLVQAEVAAAAGQPELYWSAWEDYMVHEDFDRRAYGLDDGSEYSLLSREVRLNVEPRLEQNFWVLIVTARQELGPRIVADDSGLIGIELTLEEFEARFREIADGGVEVRLEAQTPAAKEHFDRWWAELTARHAETVARRAGG